MITPQDMMMINWYKKEQLKKMKHRQMNQKIFEEKKKNKIKKKIKKFNFLHKIKKKLLFLYR